MIVWQPGITRRNTRRLSFAAVVWLVFAAFGSSAVQADTEVDIEKAGKVKAAYLRYIAEFTTWPKGVLDAAGGPIVIGAMGDDPHGVTAILERGVARKRLHAQKRPIELRRLPYAAGPELEASLAECHLLFLTGSEGVAEIWNSLREHLSERPIVTVGEYPGFSRTDGMIEFVIDAQESRVTMHIDLDAVERARLRLSSRLLGLKDGVKIVRHANEEAACLGLDCVSPTVSTPREKDTSLAEGMTTIRDARGGIR